jgi:cytosine/adenosine deaminase-related metal-dependent hydrolase
MSVVIIGNRIAGLGPSAKLHIPEGAQQVDATGKFLIPGLWDMHVHLNYRDYLPLFIANGVTGEVPSIKLIDNWSLSERYCLWLVSRA